MSYALSGAALTVAAVTSYEVLTGSDIFPDLTGPVLAGLIIGTSFLFAFTTSKRTKDRQVLREFVEDERPDSDFYFSTNSK